MGFCDLGIVSGLYILISPFLIQAKKFLIGDWFKTSGISAYFEIPSCRYLISMATDAVVF